MADPLPDEIADFANADRGFIAALDPYEVTKGIYRTSDGMTMVEGDRGRIVIDPPGRVDMPVSGVIYTRPQDELDDIDVPTFAPAGFTAGQEETVDGVCMIFQPTGGGGMNVFFPAHAALYLTDDLAVRDLTETIALFGRRAELVLSSRRQPILGKIMWYLSSQRDAHAYLHDQTLRLLGKGHTDDEIAEMIQLPPALADAWDAGPVADQVKAIYQRHLGWSASLWLPPPAETARRSVESLGGMANLVALAREHVTSGDLRFAAQLLRHGVYADPSGEVTKAMLAQVYERLGHGAHDATWRTFYLTGAEELRHGQVGIGMASALPIEQIFDALAIRVDAPAAWHETITIDWILVEGPYRSTLRHGVLIHHPVGDGDPADLTVRPSKAQLLGLLAGQGIRGVPHEGDPGALARLLGYLDSDILVAA